MSKQNKVYKVHSQEALVSEALSANEPVLLFFTNDWVASPAVIETVVNSIADEFYGEVKFVQAPKTSQTQFCQRMGLTFCPELMVIINGQVTSHAHGQVSKTSLQRMLTLVRFCIVENAASSRRICTAHAVHCDVYPTAGVNLRV